jgi:hypothetical protein
MIIVILVGHEISMDLADHRKFDDWILFWPKLFGDKLKSFSIYDRACQINPPIEELIFEVNFEYRDRWLGYQDTSWEPLQMVPKLGIFHEYARKHKLIRFITKAYR